MSVATTPQRRALRDPARGIAVRLRRGPMHVRSSHPPFCVVADVVIAIPILAGVV